MKFPSETNSAPWNGLQRQRLAAANLLNTEDIRSLGGEWAGVAEAMRAGGAAACIALRARANAVHAGGEPLFYGSRRI